MKKLFNALILMGLIMPQSLVIAEELEPKAPKTITNQIKLKIEQTKNWVKKNPKKAIGVVVVTAIVIYGAYQTLPDSKYEQLNSIVNQAKKNKENWNKQHDFYENALSKLESAQEEHDRDGNSDDK